MAKTKISQYSSTAGSNTDIDNINIAEGCSPANVNNAIRGLMAQLKDFQSANPTYYTADSDALAVGAGGTGAITANTARTNLSAAKSGANSDITSLSGLTTALSVAQGGTGATTTGGASFALKGANSDITSLTGLTTALSVAQGGTGSTSITSKGVVIGNGTSAVTTVSPGTSGNVLVSDGTDWTSAKPTISRGTLVTTTSGTSADFTGIPSWVKRITVMFNGVSTTGSSDLLVQLGTGGSPETSGYLGTSAKYSNGNTTSIAAVETAGFSIESGTGDIDYGTWVFTNITGNTWICSATVNRTTTNMFVVTGTKSLSGVLNMVRVTTVSGTPTFDAGSINILYE